MRDNMDRDRRYERLAATIRAYRAGLILCLIIILILASILLTGRRHFARAIRIDGKLVCLVPNKAAADQVRTQLLKAGQGDLPGEAVFDQQWEDCTWPAAETPVISASEAMKLLRPKLTVLVSAAGICVEDNEVVVMATKELAETALDTLKAQYISEDDKLLAAPKFRQEVLIADVQKPADEILTDIGTAVQKLSQDRKSAKTYVVKAGDSSPKIAAKHNMSVAELYQLNPGLKGRIIHPGEKLKVSAPAAPITVVTVKEKVYTKELKAEPEKIYSPTLPRGERRVVREAVPGKKKIYVKCVYENDRLVREEPLKGQVIEAPIPERVMIGTGEISPHLEEPSEY